MAEPFSQLFSVHGVSDLRQTEIHTAQLIVPELSALEVEMAIEKVRIHITRCWSNPSNID